MSSLRVNKARFEPGNVRPETEALNNPIESKLAAFPRWYEVSLTLSSPLSQQHETKIDVDIVTR